MGGFIKHFEDIGIEDLDQVGGKNASLGEMYQKLSPKGINVPNGFATTSKAFWDFIHQNKLEQPLKQLISQLDTKKYSG